eukprot:CAMPEP_0202893122 /NCGR_PEP_ID=MMETSP1392-20130828/2755_1 /ASSEMBLY_ACC=CAM_ASM_000868 /TAXON_ID=225041 /ORGANISM="Chlamydomonas chlamydogama, Strain SAG 11-48b" /LENGTH=336 /DNA_ID=CAMNT_0049577329 /DNA_START=27 /DNA_END=1038 /DNA_ORIENTATION=-
MSILAAQKTTTLHRRPQGSLSANGASHVSALRQPITAPSRVSHHSDIVRLSATSGCTHSALPKSKRIDARRSVCVFAKPSSKAQSQSEDDIDEELGDGEGSIDEDNDDDFEQDDSSGNELGLEADDTGPGISTGATSWGDAALQATQKVLKLPAMSGIELYLFRAIPSLKKLDIRLDKLDDMYGSPSIDDIEKFSRMLNLELEASLGAERAGEISFEVSSPGAERQLVLPDDLNRFAELPLRVEYSNEQGGATTQVLELVEYDVEGGSTTWRLADVRANAPTKGRGLSKKQKGQVVSLAVSQLQRVRIHVDFDTLWSCPEWVVAIQIENKLGARHF